MSIPSLLALAVTFGLIAFVTWFYFRKGWHKRDPYRTSASQLNLEKIIANPEPFRRRTRYLMYVIVTLLLVAGISYLFTGFTLYTSIPLALGILCGSIALSSSALIEVCAKAPQQKEAVMHIQRQQIMLLGPVIFFAGSGIYKLFEGLPLAVEKTMVAMAVAWGAVFLISFARLRLLRS